jgi:hypothetical protein
MTQLSIFDMAVTVVTLQKDAKAPRNPRPDRPSIEARFELFHAENPHVLAEMLALARARVAAGAKRVGAKELWEALRTHIRVNKLGNYKLDNSLTSIYSRKLIEVEPSLASVIETRKRTAKP